MKVTIITKYHGPSADIFVAAVASPLTAITEQQRRELRQKLDCDGEGPTPEDDDDASSLFFQEIDVHDNIGLLTGLINVDGQV